MSMNLSTLSKRHRNRQYSEYQDDNENGRTCEPCFAAKQQPQQNKEQQSVKAVTAGTIVAKPSVSVLLSLILLTLINTNMAVKLIRINSSSHSSTINHEPLIITNSSNSSRGASIGTSSLSHLQNYHNDTKLKHYSIEKADRLNFRRIRRKRSEFESRLTAALAPNLDSEDFTLSPYYPTTSTTTSITTSIATIDDLVPEQDDSSWSNSDLHIKSL